MSGGLRYGAGQRAGIHLKSAVANSGGSTLGSFHDATALVKLKPETSGSDENPVSGPAIVFNFLNVSKTNACLTIYSRHMKNELNEITKKLLARKSARGHTA